MSLQPEPEIHPVLRANAPWPLKAESYLMFLKMKHLPKGVYDPLEEVWGGEEFGKFDGGLGAVMIVRYSDSPVGKSFHGLLSFLLRMPLSQKSRLFEVQVVINTLIQVPTTNSSSSPETSASPIRSKVLPESPKRLLESRASTSRSAPQLTTAV
jgi:hypothetical protein